MGNNYTLDITKIIIEPKDDGLLQLVFEGRMITDKWSARLDVSPSLFDNIDALLSSVCNLLEKGSLI